LRWVLCVLISMSEAFVQGIFGPWRFPSHQAAVIHLTLFLRGDTYEAWLFN
jgi:hypothetical protein